jgi:hypothetical protein
MVPWTATPVSPQAIGIHRGMMEKEEGSKGVLTTGSKRSGSDGMRSATMM